MNTFLTSSWLLATTGLGYFLGSLGNLSTIALVACAACGLLVGLIVRFGAGSGSDGGGFDSFDFGGSSDSCDSGGSCD